MALLPESKPKKRAKSNFRSHPRQLPKVSKSIKKGEVTVPHTSHRSPVRNVTLSKGFDGTPNYTLLSDQNLLDVSSPRSRKLSKAGISVQSHTVQSELHHPDDPTLVCTQMQVSSSAEDDIKKGFYELKPKFHETGAASIYISHIVLHEKHPLLAKLAIETLKQLLMISQVMYLAPRQDLYTIDGVDETVYIILFGKVSLWTSGGVRLNGKPFHLGWTLGEEVIFDGVM